MDLSSRQKKIISIVKELQPITSDSLAKKCGVTRGALIADLTILTMCGVLEGVPRVGIYMLTNFV